MLPQAASDQYRAQQKVTGTTATAVRRLWSTIGDDFDEWGRVRDQALGVVDAGRRAAVSLALPYTAAVLEETGQNAAATGALSAAAFVTTAPDGRDLGSLYDTAVIKAKTAVKQGTAPALARDVAGRWLTMTTLTVLADTRREVFAADITQRPALTGYVRMLNPPSCRRCAILAGRWYRWNEGFQRHPRCDCQHIPAVEDVGGDLRTDPYAYFRSLSVAEQDAVFGAAEARAIRDGGDIYRAVNVSNRGLATARSARRYGTPSRLTIEDIYAKSNGDRARAIAMMRDEGYILPRGQVAVRYAPGVRTDAQVLAAGRGGGTFLVGDQRVVTGRAQRFDAAASGQRDPLNRATMTAAERRLYDATYRLEYARRNGYVPRSVGLNSADAASGARGVVATPERIEQLEAELARQITGIDPKKTPGLYRLMQALGLDSDAAAVVFDRIRLQNVARATANPRRRR
ncbi:VG15 protein [Microbacterium rhizophilus]|uniref:VG15 protein n=1 Tax=Microbacterium rhizophilus TaxID=3138934 RepID=UPI0031E7DA9E